MEESFPRGGVEKFESKKRKTENDIFQHEKAKKQKKNKKGVKGKKGGKQKKGAESEVKKKHKMEGEVSGQLGQNQPQFLSKKSLYPGMLMLGYVKQIKNYELMIALPNGLSGSVPITNISQAYTESLQKFSEAKNENVENVNTLSELFQIGMVVACKLTECDSSAGSKLLTLSINPKDVNNDLSATSLRHGMWVYGNVASQEDHGYIIDIGVKGVQTFLKNKHASRYIQLYNDGGPLRVGQCLMCKIKMKGDRMAVLTGQNRVINVTIDPLDLKNIETVESKDVPFTSLLPGMKVHAKVEKIVKDDGIVVDFNNFRGLIHKSHLTKPPDSYNQFDQVTCSILYIHPLVKTVTLTMLPHLTDYVGVPTGLYGKVKVGQTIEEATVKKIEKHRGVYLDLQSGATGFAALNNLGEKGRENMQKEFKKGSTHRCRVLGFYPMEALVIVTTKQSILDEKYMRISDIQSGEIIECTVKNLHNKGINVEISKGIMGMIPTMHLADVTLQHPEQKFKTNDKLKCRVLNINKKHSKVTLTHKKSLVNSKYPIISSYSQIQAGQILEGYIHVVKDFGCLVRFYSNVQGLAPRTMLSTEYIQYPEKLFYQGQVVRCKVVDVQPTSKKLTLTFVLEGKIEFGQKKREMPKDFKVGRQVKCKVEKKSETGIDVELQPTNMKAFIPKMHLSDSKEMCVALWDMYQPGDIIEHAMYWHKSKVPLLTCKPCLLSAAENEEEFVTKFDSLVPGTMLAGAVKNIMSYGIFVEFANGLFGLVPMQYAVDQRVGDIKMFYQLGQTVLAKVVEVNKEKKRFLASLRMQDCYHGNTEVGLELTWNYLKERERLLETLGKMQDKKGILPQIKFGSVHKATVTKMSKIGAICELENGVKAVAVMDHIRGEVKVGDKLDCIVLYIDLKQNCVEVSLDSKLVPFVKKNIGKGKSKRAEVGETLNSTVLLIKEDFVVVGLKAIHKGQLAYLPAKRHWNDVLERHQYTVGQENKVVVKRVEGDVILASLKVHEDKLEEDEDKLTHIPAHNLKMGDICDAIVRKVYKDQIYINVAKTHGRIHVTEMLDHIEHGGSNPTLNMKNGQEIKVRVIGFRENKTKRYLPISHPNLKRAMPDCTMKPSILSLKELPSSYACSGNNFSVGDKIVAYVDCYSCNNLNTQVTPCVKGRVHLLNISTNLELLKKPEHHFKNGQCYNATVIKTVNDKQVELSLLENPFEEVSVGKETRGIVTCIKKDSGLVLQLADKMRGTLDITDMSDNYVDQPTDAFKHGSVITAKVIKIEKLSKQAVLSMRPNISDHKPVDPRIENVTNLTRGQIIKGYVSQISAKGITIRLGVGIKFVLSADRIIKGRHVTAQTLKKEFKVGNVITVKFLGYDKDNEVELSLLGSQGLDIPSEPLPDSPSQKGKTDRKRSISNSSADSDSVKAKKTKLKNIETANEIDENIELEIDGLELMESEESNERDSTNSSVISDAGAKNVEIDAEVDANKDWFDLKIWVPVTGEGEEESVERSVTETSDRITRKEISDSDDESVMWSDVGDAESSTLYKSEDEKTDINFGKSFSVSITKDAKTRKVVAKQKDNGNVSLSDNSINAEKPSDQESSDSEKEPEEIEKNQVENTKRSCTKPSKEEVSHKKKQKKNDDDVEIKVVAKSDVEVSQKPVLEVDEGFSWDTDFKLPTKHQGEISSDDSDDEDQKKKVKKSKEQLRQEKKEEENRLYQAEMKRLEGEVQPETADDFDRLVLQSPDSSLVWLRYMAFHLETTEIDKARAVAERALKTISFREEQEKLNVWVAYLNLENMYGTEDSVKKVLTRAVQQNDQVSIYLQMVNIYVKSGKTEDAEQLFNTLVKKHTGNKDVWIKFGEFYFQQGRVDSARKLLQRTLKSLVMKQHVDTIIKFAQMEFKYGEPERGKTMFENTLSSYPKRTDLWSVYIDMVTKLGELETARSIYDRVITHKMSAKKMKFFFKKYLQFEEKHSSADQVAEVKKKALQYVESQGFVDE